MKPSERIIKIHKALKILDGQHDNDPNFNNMTFFEKAILQYLDEEKDGTELQQRKQSHLV